MKAFKIIVPILILMAVLLLIRITGVFDAPPAITDISVGNITGSSAVVSWKTDKPASSQVHYGQSTTYDLKTAADNRQSTAHSVNINGLKPGTAYHFSVTSITNGKQATAPDFSFATLVQKIVYESRSEDSARIFIMNADGTGQVKLSNGPGDDMMPSVSHDGRKIAFMSDKNGKYQIFVMDIDGRNLKQLTFSKDNSSHPAWSPDDTRIVFSSTMEKTSQLWVMDADGSNLKKLTSGDRGVSNSPSWSPDGKRIVFNSVVVTADPWKYYIYLLDLDSGSITRLTDSGEDANPCWTPDGKKITFVSYNSKKQGLYTMNPDGSTVALLTSGAKYANYVSWSPDGSKIAFASKSSVGDWQIYSANADGSGLTRLTNNKFEDTSPSWTPFIEWQGK